MHSNALRILCAADIHIPRRPTRIPKYHAADYSAAASWSDLVDYAIQNDVDAVLLAGDVVDQENRYFEAYGPLERGVRRLKDAEIAIVAVAGNHDQQILHELSDEITQDHMIVLGRGGEWERWTMHNHEGDPVLHVDGWSFPDPHYSADPSRSYHMDPPPDRAPVVGLLHCDLDSHESRYAPVMASSLMELLVSAWVLGHRHVPESREEPGRPPLLIPGSLLALDPGETGSHGAFILELEPDREPHYWQVSLSRARYESVTVNVTEVTDAGELRNRVAGAFGSRLDSVLEESHGYLDVLCCRLNLTGRSALLDELESILENVVDFEREKQGVHLVIDPRVWIDVLPAINLDHLARGNDAPAVLATLLQQLDAPRDGSTESADVVGNEGGVLDIISHVDERASAIADRPYYASVTEAGEGAETRITASLRRQAARLLDELMRQKNQA